MHTQRESVLNRLKQGFRRSVPERLQTTIKQSVFKLKSRSFQPYVKAMNAEGTNFSFLIGDPVARSWYEGVWFSHELRFIRDYIIKPGDVVFDCGAHHGCTTVLFSKWTGHQGRVVAFEPFPANADVVEKNIQLNRLTIVNALNRLI